MQKKRKKENKNQFKMPQQIKQNKRNKKWVNAQTPGNNEQKKSPKKKPKNEMSKKMKDKQQKENKIKYKQ